MNDSGNPNEIITFGDTISRENQYMTVWGAMNSTPVFSKELKTKVFLYIIQMQKVYHIKRR